MTKLTRPSPILVPTYAKNGPQTPLAAPQRPKSVAKPLTQAPLEAFKVNWTLEPGQSLSQFLDLRSTWDAQLAAEGLPDLEVINRYGYRGNHSRTANLPRPKDDVLTHYMQVGGWLHEADLSGLEPHMCEQMAKFILAHYVEGYSLRNIKALLHNTEGKRAQLPGTTRPSRRNRRRTGDRMPGLYWLHKALTRLLSDFEQSKLNV